MSRIRQIRIYKAGDNALVQGLVQIAAASSLQSPRLLVRPTRSGGSHIEAPVGEIQEALKGIADTDCVLGFLHLHGQMAVQGNRGAGQVSIHIIREPMSDLLEIEAADNVAFEPLAMLVRLTLSAFPAYEHTPTLDKVLGNELAEFYSKREQALSTLEDISQRLIAQYAEHQRELLLQTQQVQSDLHATAARHRAKLDEEHAERIKRLEQREADITTRTKELDDRDSKHARRQHQREIKSRLEQLDSKFTLSKGTGNKRILIHVFFIVVIASSLGSAIYAFPANPDTASVASWVKLGLSSAGFFIFATAYLSWMNHWFSQHADEEFRLKRLAIDMDRASWLVETVSEWQAEHPNTPLPEDLLRQLGVGMFNTPSAGSGEGQHALLTLLGKATRVRVTTPGASVDLDQKGMDRINSK